MAPELTTPRLRLRHWGPDDRAPFAALNADPEVMAHFPEVLDRDRSDAMADRIDHALRTDDFGLWAVEVIDGSPFVGFVGLSRVDMDVSFSPCVEIGWRLARGAWGHGYATEAGRSILSYGLGVCGLTEVLSWTAVGNHRSRAVMTRLGMAHDPSLDFDHPILVGHALAAHVVYRTPPG